MFCASLSKQHADGDLCMYLCMFIHLILRVGGEWVRTVSVCVCVRVHGCRIYRNVDTLDK